MRSRVLAIVCGVLAASGFAGTAAALTVDTSSRSAVAAFYRDQYLPSEEVAHGWTGSGSPTCDPGTLSTAYLSAALRRLNYFRAYVGFTSELAWDATRNAGAQQAALIMSVNQT